VCREEFIRALYTRSGSAVESRMKTSRRHGRPCPRKPVAQKLETELSPVLSSPTVCQASMIDQMRELLVLADNLALRRQTRGSRVADD